MRYAWQILAVRMGQPTFKHGSTLVQCIVMFSEAEFTQEPQSQMGLSGGSAGSSVPQPLLESDNATLRLVIKCLPWMVVVKNN